ncbi:MAG: protoporphyrinogen oxidase [Deltaproteobacteria bacterium]|nr:protoporphyrinogen oxidase [Deltaproteobacteria bacterium]
MTVCVVGAGAAGLSCAYELKSAGQDVVLLEAASRAGGKIGSVRQGGFLMENAALGLLDREGDLAELCARLKLTPVPADPSAHERFAVRHGVLHQAPEGPGSALGTGLLSFGEKLSLLGEPFRKAAPRDDETIHEFFQRRFGAAGAFAGDLMQLGVYAGDPERLELASCFPSLAAFERARGSVIKGAMAEGKARKASGRARPRLSSFANGMQELTEALAQAVGDSLRLDTPVRAVARTASGYTLTLGDGSTQACTDLVLTLPAPAMASLLKPLDDRLGALLSQLEAAPITVVRLAYPESAFARPPRGFGVLAPGRPMIGLLLPSRLWSGRAPDGTVLLSALVGGARARESAALDDKTLLALVTSELQQWFGLEQSVQPLFADLKRWSEAIPQPVRGHRARVAEIDKSASDLGHLHLGGAWLHGVSVLDCLRDGRRIARALSART